MDLRPRLVVAIAAGTIAVWLTAATVPVGAVSTGDLFGTHGAESRSYRKVLFPTRDSWHAGAVRASPQVNTASGSGLLEYGGGVGGIGVTTGAPRVYVVFWGSQWGTTSSSGGVLQFTGDTTGVAPRVQAFLAGLGTNAERWSGVTTQYCDGVAAGSTSCPSSAPHVAYPTGGALAGVWFDAGAPAPAQATDDQLAGEAVAAAIHFGNFDSVANRDAQYVVVSPPSTHPGGFGTPTGQFCGWHAAAQASVGIVAFTNLPYVTDAGANCGMNYVHAGPAGVLDGVTIVEGHEYTETLTDQIPPAGWTDAAGYEVADKCAWIGVGGAGGAQDLALATGTFPVAGLWSNDDGACVVGHDVVTSTPPVSLVAVGASDTAALDAQILGGAGTSVASRLNADVTVPGDSLCGTMTFGPSGITPPADSDAGLAAFAGSLAGTYPDPATDAGRGCIDIVRSDQGPQG